MKKTLLILAVFTLGTTAFSQIPNYVPSNGLVGWWPFNGNANDESGNGNNGTVNGASLTTDRFGNANSAYNFDGNSNYIDAGNNGSLNSNIISISAWYNAIDYGSPSQNYQGNLVSKREQSGWGGAYQLALSSSSSNIVYAPYTIAGQNGNVFSTPLTTNQWIHVLYIHDLNSARIYINGVLSSTTLVSGGLTSNNIPVWFGARPNAGNLSHFLNGKLDDIGIWNRALTVCEIQDLYHAQLSSQAVSAGVDQTICSGDNVTLSGYGGSNYQWNNNVVDGQAFAPTQSNAYVVNGTDTLGCQGTDTVVITVLENATNTLTETALDSYTLNGQTYTQSGTYTQTLTAANGCDSTITLNLTLNFTGIDELGTGAKKLVKITDLNGKIMLRRKNTLMLFIYEDGTVERVVEME